MKRNQDSKSEEDEKVKAVGFARGKPIDLRSDSDNEMMFVALGIMVGGPIDLGSNFDNESRISTNMTKRALTIIGL